MKHVFRQWLACVLSVVMVFSLLPAMVFAEPASGFTGAESGTGLESDPYLIQTAEQLRALSTYVNDGNDCTGVCFKLTADIDLGGQEWTPIGNEDHPFSGIFDGGNFTVSGLKINNSSGAAGLFGNVGGTGTVKNLYVEGEVSTGSSGASAGGIAGQSAGTIDNCHNVATVSGGHTGGIVGEATTGIITGCSNSGTVNGSNGTGGILGYVNNSLESIRILICYNSGSTNGSGMNTGGIAGMIMGTIENPGSSA